MDTQAIGSSIQGFSVDDVEYLRHGDTPWLARVFKPHGEGPFPAVIDLHGGAWCLQNRFSDKVRHEWLAGHGVVVIALDWRTAREGCYPKSVQDINYAVRWSKAHAKELKTRPDLIGISGQSSGGHLAMLVGMRPNDPRYCSIASEPASPKFDATVRGVIMSWPVINPLSRYRYAKSLAASPNPPEWASAIVDKHNQFWPDEAAMADGNPLLMLERGEIVNLPPALWHQCIDDPLHDYKDEESASPLTEAPRFAENYRKAGGDIELCYFNGERNVGHAPDLTKIGDTFERMLKFIGTHFHP
jgi:acetyl esterase/lipase